MDGEEPFWVLPFEFEQSALVKAIAYLKGKSGVIEPFTLQLLCRHAEAIARDKATEGETSAMLALTDFNNDRDFEQVLKNFYQGTLGKLEQKLGEGRAQSSGGARAARLIGSRGSPAIIKGRPDSLSIPHR